MRTEVEVASLSLPRDGSLVSENQDCLRVGPPTNGGWADFAGIVADGVGSSDAPGEASRVAADTFLRHLQDKFEQPADQIASYQPPHFRQIMEHSLLQAHQQVTRVAAGGKSTAAAVCIQGDWLLVANVGDSPIYLAGRQGIQRVSIDQVDASGNPTDVLGGRAAPPAIISCAERRLRSGDVLLLCSDGLLRLMTEEGLSSWLASATTAAEAVERLKAQLASCRLPDDLSVIVARVGRVGAPFWLAEPPGNAPLPDAPQKELFAVPSFPESVDTLANLDRRMTAVERSVNNPGNTQELNRLRNGLVKLDERLSEMEAVSHRRAQRARTPLALVALVFLALGGALGYALHPQRPEKLPIASESKPPAVFHLVRPTDLQTTVEQRPYESFLLWKYRAVDGSLREAIYPYALGGKPGQVLVLSDASDRAPHHGSHTPTARTGSE